MKPSLQWLGDGRVGQDKEGVRKMKPSLPQLSDGKVGQDKDKGSGR